MAGPPALPIYESLLIEALKALAVDSGTVTTPAAVGTNILNDNAKNWANDIHKNRLVKIVRGAGAGQMALIQNNTAKSLVIKQSWMVALDTTSVYVILDVDIVSEFTALKEALSRVLEVSEDSGTATGGSNTTIVDTGKNWGVDMWQNATVHVIHDGVEYVRLCSSNTADTLTIAALPTGVSVAAGDAYAIRRPVTIADITDRTTREIGIVDSLRKWGGTALTGRDISLDLARLDIALSAFRDALRGAGTKDFTTLETDIESILAKLDVALSTRTAASQLPASLTTAGNLKQSVEERLISKITRDITPTAVGSFWLPETGHIDLSKFLASTWGIYAPTTANMVVNCYLNISHDGGTTWRRAAGYSVSNADFVRDQWNTIDCPLKLAQAKLEVVIETAYPVELDLMCIAKP